MLTQNRLSRKEIEFDDGTVEGHFNLGLFNPKLQP
jgi:hypothetical protein